MCLKAGGQILKRVNFECAGSDYLRDGSRRGSYRQQEQPLKMSNTTWRNSVKNEFVVRVVSKTGQQSNGWTCTRGNKALNFRWGRKPCLHSSPVWFVVQKTVPSDLYRLWSKPLNKLAIVSTSLRRKYSTVNHKFSKM